MKQILITGATGFIGRVLVKQLSHNNRIRVLVRKECEGDWDSCYVCDFNSDIIPEKAFEGIDTVYHLAAFTHDNRKSIVTGLSYELLNTDITTKLANAASKNGVKSFLFVSSVKAGGSPGNGLCVDESYQGVPDGVYGHTKRNAEINLLEIGRQTGMHISIVRPALVYGPGLKGNLLSMINGIRKGWFPPLPNTYNMRSMVHVNDLINAIILASVKNKANGEIYIVTDGKKYSSHEIYTNIRIAMGKKIQVLCVPKILFLIAARIGDTVGCILNPPFDSYRYNKLLGDDCYCSDKISKDLGFKSTVIFNDALQTMLNKN